jgi:hypothetical protein
MITKALVGGLVMFGMSISDVGVTFAKVGTAKSERSAARSAGKQCADPARVEEATLAITDVPTGFVEDLPPAPINVLYLGGEPVRLSRLGLRTVAHARHAYSQSGSDVAGPYVTDAANVFASVKDAKTVMKAFRRSAATAKTWQQTMTDPAGFGTYTATATSFPRFGDDMLTVRITGTFRDAGLGVEQDIGEITYVVLRHGPVLSVMVVANADAASFVSLADAKVRSILVACPKKKPAK